MLQLLGYLANDRVVGDGFALCKSVNKIVGPPKGKGYTRTDLHVHIS